VAVAAAIRQSGHFGSRYASRCAYRNQQIALRPPGSGLIEPVRARCSRIDIANITPGSRWLHRLVFRHNLTISVPFLFYPSNLPLHKVDERGGSHFFLVFGFFGRAPYEVWPKNRA
jgi:hypothetical protein